LFVYLDTTYCKSAKANIFEELGKCVVVEIVCKILQNTSDNANEDLRSILGLMCKMIIPTMENCTYLTFLKMDMFTIYMCIPQLNEIHFQQNLKMSLVASSQLFILFFINNSQRFLTNKK
jgi:hypothetical protein